MGGTVPIGRLQFIAYPPIIQKRQAFLRYRSRAIYRHNRSSLSILRSVNGTSLYHCSRWYTSAITPACKLKPAILATRLEPAFGSSIGGRLCNVNTLRPWWGPMAIRYDCMDAGGRVDTVEIEHVEMLRFKADPNLCIRVTVPVCALDLVNPALCMICVARVR